MTIEEGGMRQGEGEVKGRTTKFDVFKSVANAFQDDGRIASGGAKAKMDGLVSTPTQAEIKL
jgi:hypothetical protein